MSYLELFPNLAVYRVKTRDEVIDLPIGITDVTALAQTKDNGSMGISVNLERDEPLATGDQVTVDGITGRIIKLGSNFVDLQVNSKCSLVQRVYNPDNIQSFGNYTKRYRLNKNHGVNAIVAGILPQLWWTPTYTVILGEDPNLILKLLFTAQVRAIQNESTAFYPFEVDHLVFNTQPVLQQANRREPMFQRMKANAQNGSFQPDLIDLGIDKTYSWNKPATITSELSFPLHEIDNIKSPRVYFLPLENNAKPLYGYSFDVNEYIPTGPARIHSNDFSFKGLSTLESIGKRVNLKVGLENKLLANTTVETRSLPSQNEQQNRQEMTFHSIVQSNFKRPVTLIAEMDIFGTLISSDPIINDRLGNKLIWYYQIQPGSNEISGTVIIEF
jgi:hypothetical protein